MSVRKSSEVDDVEATDEWERLGELERLDMLGRVRLGELGGAKRGAEDRVERSAVGGTVSRGQITSLTT